MILFTLGRILQVNGALLLFPVVISILYQESMRHLLSFIITAILSYSIGYILALRQPKIDRMYAKEGFVIVSLSWLLLSLVGSFPFVLNGDIPFIVDAFFETASGFTTTGSSILNDIEVLAHSSLFWRSFTHLIGGMGVLVFALAVLPKTGSEAVHIMRAEVPGPSFGKIASKLSSSARILYMIYLIMTVVLFVALYLAGMPSFDALVHSFGVAGTGGFGILNGSIAPYNSVAIESILAIGMILFGVNFNIYYYMLVKHVREVYKSEELRWYLGAIIGATVLITLQLTLQRVQPLVEALRNSVFTVSSVITTTGFATDNFGSWPLSSQVVLLFLMFIGGMAGSTAGGLKVSRVAIMIKTAFSELKRMTYPNRVLSIHFESKNLDGKMIKAVAHYFLVYILLFSALVLLMSFELEDFISTFSAVTTTFNNIGPGLGMVGPNATFSFLSIPSKLLLTMAMFMGRLEIFPILILFSPGIWRSRA